MMEALMTLGVSTLLGYGVVILAAGAAMWVLSKLPRRLRRTMGYGDRRSRQ